MAQHNILVLVFLLKEPGNIWVGPLLSHEFLDSILEEGWCIVPFGNQIRKKENQISELQGIISALSSFYADKLKLEKDLTEVIFLHCWEYSNVIFHQPGDLTSAHHWMHSFFLYLGVIFLFLFNITSEK